MLPFPSAASGLRDDIVEKLLLIWLSENCSPGGRDELPLPGEPEDEFPLQLQQAAKTRAAAPAHAVHLVPERNGPPHYGRD